MALADVCRTDASKGNYFLDFKMGLAPKHHGPSQDFKEIFEDEFKVPTGQEVKRCYLYVACILRELSHCSNLSLAFVFSNL